PRRLRALPRACPRRSRGAKVFWSSSKAWPKTVSPFRRKLSPKLARPKHAARVSAILRSGSSWPSASSCCCGRCVSSQHSLNARGVESALLGRLQATELFKQQNIVNDFQHAADHERKGLPG